MLFVAAAAVVALIGFALSPAGRPLPARRRSGGLSRALAARADRLGER